MSKAGSKISFDGVYIKEVAKTYQELNLDLMKNSRKFYDLAIIKLYILELESGFIVKRINKTYRKGTKVIFKRCESQEEASKYSEKVNEMVREYKEKYKEKNYDKL